MQDPVQMAAQENPASVDLFYNTCVLFDSHKPVLQVTSRSLSRRGLLLFPPFSIPQSEITLNRGLNPVEFHSPAHCQSFKGRIFVLKFTPDLCDLPLLSTVKGIPLFTF